MSTALSVCATRPLPSIATVRSVVLLVSFFGIFTFGSVPSFPLTETLALASPAAVGVQPEAPPPALQPTSETRSPATATALRSLDNDREGDCDCDTQLLSEEGWRRECSKA